jgi:hypothetical protein
MALTNCSAPSLPPVDVAAPPRLAADLCVPPAAKPVLPPAAGIPQPVDDAGRQALSVFLNWASDLNLWGEELSARAVRTAASPACQGAAG